MVLTAIFLLVLCFIVIGYMANKLNQYEAKLAEQRDEIAYWQQAAGKKEEQLVRLFPISHAAPDTPRCLVCGDRGQLFDASELVWFPCWKCKGRVQALPPPDSSSLGKKGR